MPAPTVKPLSVLAIAKDKLQQLVSQSPTFQTRTKLGSPAAALASIYKTYLRLTGNAEFAGRRPFAIVEQLPSFEYALFAGGTQNYLEPSGELGLYVTDNDNYPDDPDASSTDFENFAGGVIDDLVNVSSAGPLGDNLSVVNTALLALVQTPADQSLTKQSYWYAVFRIDWKS